MKNTGIKLIALLKRFYIISLIISIVLFLLCAFLFFQIIKMNGINAKLTSENRNLTQDLESLIIQKQDLTDQLSNARNQINDFTEQVGSLTGTVNKLETLKKTDKELLRKYSKVYFLNENYSPLRLEKISDKYLYDTKRELLFHGDLIPKLNNMLEDALDHNIDIKVVSAFRSFDEQESLKYNYKVTYGAGTANAFSADQGYSEHQLGTTVDLAYDGDSAFNRFDSTPAYEWLTKNAYKYGFILSYPKNNTYYKFEPWHWRYVGKLLAEKLHEENKYFYDYDQRNIDGYLLYFFD